MKRKLIIEILYWLNVDGNLTPTALSKRTKSSVFTISHCLKEMRNLDLIKGDFEKNNYVLHPYKLLPKGKRVLFYSLKLEKLLRRSSDV